MLEKRRGSNDSSVTVASLVLGFSLGFFIFYLNRSLRLVSQQG